MMRLVRTAWAVAGAAGLLVGGYWTLRLGYADWMARKPGPDALARAVKLAPWNASYRVRLAAAKGQVGEDLGAAIPDLERAVALKPGYAAAWIELGLRSEGRGELARAESCLREAARVDRTFEPRWALANYYFRREEKRRFWEWARRAGEMAYGDARPLFRLSWEMTPDARLILERLAPKRGGILAQYLGFLVSENHLEGAEEIEERLSALRDRAHAGVLLDYCHRLVDTGRVEPALRAWNRLAERGVIEGERLAPEEGKSLTNGGFRRDPLGRGFDWRMPGPAGVSLARGDPSGVVRLAFSGEQPEECECLWQWAPVVPGRRYRLRFEYQTVGAPGASGLRWRVVEAGSGAELAPGAPDLAADHWTAREERFETRAGTRLVRLTLGYRRAPGTARIQGALWMRGLRLELER